MAGFSSHVFFRTFADEETPGPFITTPFEPTSDERAMALTLKTMGSQNRKAAVALGRLTPGRQRDYAEHIATQSETKQK